MADICLPDLAELLDRIPDRHLMTGPQLAAAVGAQEARDIFMQLSKLIVDKNTSAET